MKKERVSKAEIFAEIRQNGLRSIEQVYAVVLETNSKISVIPNDNNNDIGFPLSDVLRLPDGLRDNLKGQNDCLKTKNKH